MKSLLISIVISAIATVAFFTLGFHTYFTNQVVNEELAFSPAQVPSQTESTAEVDGEVSVITKDPVQVSVSQGELTRIDLFHRGEGLVELMEYDNGSRYVRFNSVDIVNGPDLYVYVSDQAVPGNTLESLGSYTDLGRLKGNQGTMIYELPQIDHDIQSVVVWCERFGVLFTYATLTQ